jgi:integrase
MKDLTAKQVAALRAPGKHRVSRNLYLQAIETGARTWLFRYERNSVAHWHGLGSYDLVSLAEAREKALACRKLLLTGVDPIDHARAQKQHALLAAVSTITFKACAERYIKAHAAGWQNDRHRKQWPSTLEAYAYPLIGELPVQAIDTGLVLRLLEPIWHDKPETASRVRGRIERILDWAAVRGYRTGDNPARWRGHLQSQLPAKSKVRAAEHHPSLPYDELGAFMGDLRRLSGIAPRALEFAILTVARTGEALGARWSEIDFHKRLWLIPATRMKTRKEHRVPLSGAVLTLLEALPREGDFVFVGAKAGRPPGNNALFFVLDRMGRSDLTVHGFRSSFADWCAETTGYPSEVREMALAHAVGDKVEASYRRGDLFAKRRRLMADWARYCASPQSQPQAEDVVVPLARKS